jgi:hypothetical protein
LPPKRLRFTTPPAPAYPRRGSELKLDVSRYADERRAAGLHPLQGLEARNIRRQKIGEIELEPGRLAARHEQLRDLGFSEPAGEADDSSIALVHDSDPALHEAAQSQD